MGLFGSTRARVTAAAALALCIAHIHINRNCADIRQVMKKRKKKKEKSCLMDQARSRQSWIVLNQSQRDYMRARVMEAAVLAPN